MFSGKFSKMMDELFGARKIPEDETKETPIVPADEALLADLANDTGPYGQVMNGIGSNNRSPSIAVEYAGNAVLAEVIAAVGQENISSAPKYMREPLCKLAVISGERIEFYSQYRNIRETEPTFLKGLELWLKRHAFRLEDPKLDYDDRDGWEVFAVDKDLLDQVCPKIGFEKNGRVIASELVYIFAGIKNTSLQI